MTFSVESFKKWRQKFFDDYGRQPAPQEKEVGEASPSAQNGRECWVHGKRNCGECVTDETL